MLQKLKSFKSLPDDSRAPSSTGLHVPVLRQETSLT
jgi:hypothetical protein